MHLEPWDGQSMSGDFNQHIVSRTKVQGSRQLVQKLHPASWSRFLPGKPSSSHRRASCRGLPAAVAAPNTALALPSALLCCGGCAVGRWGGWTNSIQVGVLQSLVPQCLIGDRDDLELAAQTASAQRWYMHQVRLKRSNDNCYKFRAGTNLSHHVGHGCLGRGDGAEGTCCILGIAFVSHDAGGESSHGWGSRRAWRWA